MIKFKKFTVKEKSTFQYWFYHWLAFNYTAWKLGVWKPKWLLHDIEKPWHKHHNSHHIFYGRRNGMNKIDWLGAVIDWECSHLTKCVAVRNGRQEVDYLVNTDIGSKYTDDEREEIRKNCYPILDYLGL